jgi:hypothetical protein
MSNEDRQYHRQREQQCRMLAERATDPDIRRRHEELAQLHARRAQGLNGAANPSAELNAA